MAFSLGVVLFAVAICLSIAAHEAGHMTAARLCGMRVRRYFVGFGPTVWSFRRGHTEYGLKAIPLGGFCDIAGMTKMDPLTEDERPYAMYSKPAWQRIIVLLGGIIVNVALTLALVYVVAVGWGLPSMSVHQPATVARTACVPPSQSADGTLSECSGPGPAERSGVLPGDTFVDVNGQAVADFPSFSRALSQAVDAERNGTTAAPGDTLTVPAVVERQGQRVPLTLQVQLAQRMATNGKPVTLGLIGISVNRPEGAHRDYTPLSAIGGTFRFTGELVDQTVTGLVNMPKKVPGVVRAITGQQREQDSPMSVVGASRIGGELVEYNQWPLFLLTLASLNLFLAGFNLLPLPPLDGGHVAVVVWEKLRDSLRRRRGLAPLGPVDYRALMPLTYAATAVLVAFGVLVIVADVVNPIRLF